MTIQPLPSNLVKSFSRQLMTAVSAPSSGFTGTQQVQDWGGEWWQFQFEMAITQGREGRVLSAFFAALGGIRTPFLFADPSLYPASGLGAPLVNGAGQTGNSLITDGWAAAGLLTGDFFSIGTDAATRFYQVTSDVVPSGGAATVNFVPRLRVPPADNAPLEVVAPKVLLRLTAPIPAVISGADKYQFTVSAREAI